MSAPPPEFWRETPCGHPPDPVAWVGDDQLPICHCGCFLDGSPLPDGMVDLPPEIEFVIPCGKCGCAVGIPQRTSEPNREAPIAQDVIDALRLVLTQDDASMEMVRLLVDEAPETDDARGVDLLLRLIRESRLKVALR